MNYFISKENFDKCEVCAYHESGHIVFAYLCGYTCREVQLINKLGPEGFSSYAMIDYGKDSFLASKFIGLNPDVHFFKSLPLAQRLESIEVGQRLSRIFLGGSVATAVFLNGGNVNIPLPLQIDFTDLLRVEFINYVFEEISDHPNDNLIENGLSEALYSFHNIHTWNAVDTLAARLLSTNHLDKGDIEECLEGFGLLQDRQSAMDASL